MAASPDCALCGAPNSWLHSFIECSMARCGWALASEELLEHMCMASEPSAKQWLFTMMDSVPHGEFTTMVVTLWAIWIHEGEFQSPLSTNLFIKNFLMKLQGQPKPHVITKPTRNEGTSRTGWRLCPEGFAKLNVDGVVARNGINGAVGAVCRDRDGTFLGSSVVVFHEIGDRSTPY